LLAENTRDLEARLMLAGLMRRTSRFEEAKKQLDQLERFEGAEKWEREIAREWEYLAEKKSPEKIQAETKEQANEIIAPAA
jgi:hypothetical protein